MKLFITIMSELRYDNTLLSPSAIRHFQQRVLKWYKLNGRKTLPWQIDKTPYKVWVSEVMLQQTQVKTVIPFFNRFLETLPTIADLANVTEDTLMHLWSGLGYYSRAKNLKKAAITLLQVFNGELPKSIDELTQLAGIGRTTAGAILSLGHHISAPILDGNVKRVLLRFHNLSAPIESPVQLKQLWSFATQYQPANQETAAFTQAMMDIGSLVCTRTKPNCTICPLQADCLAKRFQTTHLIPVKKRKSPLPVKQCAFLILKQGDNYLLQKRPGKGIWSGLWSFPEIHGNFDTATLKAFCAQQFRLTNPRLKHLTPFRHTFTHFHLDILPILVHCPKSASKAMTSSQQIWYKQGNENQLGLPKPVHTLLSILA